MASIVSLPPGLHNETDPETATWSRARRRHAAAAREVATALNSKIDSMNACLGELILMVQDIHQGAALQNPCDRDLHSRVDRLETLYACTSPSVDEVLELAFRQATQQKDDARDEPEKENSPNKHLNFDIYSDLGLEEDGHPMKVISENGDCCTRTDACVQTASSMVASKECQTGFIRKLRKSRCHGRAVQTEEVHQCEPMGGEELFMEQALNPMTMACSWEQLPQEAWRIIYDKFTGESSYKSCVANCSSDIVARYGDLDKKNLKEEQFKFNGRYLSEPMSIGNQMMRKCSDCGFPAMKWREHQGAIEVSCSCNDYMALTQITIKDEVFWGRHRI